MISFIFEGNAQKMKRSHTTFTATLYALLFIGFTLLFSCNKLDIADGTPPCIKKDIQHMDECADCTSANVNMYTFQGITVYRMDPGSNVPNKDIKIRDNECNLLGIIYKNTGHDTVNGESFSKAIFQKQVWVKK